VAAQSREEHHDLWSIRLMVARVETARLSRQNDEAIA
jgi:hypothetical protein